MSTLVFYLKLDPQMRNEFKKFDSTSNFNFKIQLLKSNPNFKPQTSTKSFTLQMFNPNINC